MADLKPIGSEKLQGQDKIQRILEIARYKENIPQSINETSRIEFGKTLADGNQYEIVKEKLGYVIKKNINESLEYMDPMKNRKYYKSYSQALKRLNLLAGELNRLNENVEEVSMFTLEEQKKFTLKLPKSEVPTPEPAPAPEAVSDDTSMDMDVDMDMSADPESGDESMDMDMEMDTETTDMGAEEEEVDFKVIQKLTGKLGQKIRTMNDSVGMTSEDIKYVLNSILSALDLENLDDEDKEDVIAKIEEVETDYDSTEMDLDMTGDEEMDMDLDMDLEGETTEGSMFLGQKQGDKDRFYDEMENEFHGDFDFDYDEEEYDDFDDFISKYPNQNWFRKGRSDDAEFGRDSSDRKFWDRYKEKFGGPFKLRKRRSEMGEGDLRDKYDGRDGKVIGVYSNIKKQRNEEMSEEEKTHSSISKIMDGIFTESKVDKVLEKYFVISEDEKKSDNKKVSKNNSIDNLAETTEQKLAAEFIMKESKGAKFLGKTNKNNLVIENQGVQIKVTTKGEVL
jgi:hypothetical protein